MRMTCPKELHKKGSSQNGAVQSPDGGMDPSMGTLVCDSFPSRSRGNQRKMRFTWIEVAGDGLCRGERKGIICVGQLCCTSTYTRTECFFTRFRFTTDLANPLLLWCHWHRVLLCLNVNYTSMSHHHHISILHLKKTHHVIPKIAYPQCA